ncbi:MAG: hypothetical protein JO145_06335 [Acidobacteriaceae bacterium]|nr:hypothetical protein [Acidobacteriaceae bacterium]
MRKSKNASEDGRGKMRLKRDSRKNVSRRRKAKPMHELLACRDAYREHGERCQESLHQILQRVFVAALDLKKDNRAWKAFSGDDFWGRKRSDKGPNEKHRKKPLCFALKFVLAAYMKEERQLAANYARALDHLVEKGVKPNQIAAAIGEAGGIEKLAWDAAEAMGREFQVWTFDADGQVCRALRKLKRKPAQVVHLTCKFVAKDNDSGADMRALWIRGFTTEDPQC